MMTRRELFKGVLATLVLVFVPASWVKAATHKRDIVVSNSSGTLWGSDDLTCEEMQALRFNRAVTYNMARVYNNSFAGDTIYFVNGLEKGWVEHGKNK